MCSLGLPFFLRPGGKEASSPHVTGSASPAASDLLLVLSDKRLIRSLLLSTLLAPEGDAGLTVSCPGSGRGRAHQESEEGAGTHQRPARLPGLRGRERPSVRSQDPPRPWNSDVSSRVCRATSWAIPRRRNTESPRGETGSLQQPGSWWVREMSSRQGTRLQGAPLHSQLGSRSTLCSWRTKPWIRGAGPGTSLAWSAPRVASSGCLSPATIWLVSLVSSWGQASPPASTCLPLPRADG